MAKLVFFRVDDDGTVQGKENEAYLNGYVFGDRLMEDVYFGFQVNEAQDDLEVFIHPSSVDYFAKFNAKHWFDVAREYALEADLFTDIDCQDDCICLYDFDRAVEDQAAHWEEVPPLD